MHQSFVVPLRVVQQLRVVPDEKGKGLGAGAGALKAKHYISVGVAGLLLLFFVLFCFVSIQWACGFCENPSQKCSLFKRDLLE